MWSYSNLSSYYRENTVQIIYKFDSLVLYIYNICFLYSINLELTTI